MASSLNSGATDFKLNQSKETVTPLLIPPSEFEKPLTFRSRDGQDTLKQLQHLQMETGDMKCCQSHLQTQVRTVPCAHFKNDYADELIKRQAGEIFVLRSELLRSCQTHEQESTDWEKKISLLEEKRDTEVQMLEKHLARAQDEFGEKLSLKESEISALSVRLERTKILLDERVVELEEELKTRQSHSDNNQQQLESELRNKSQIVEDQAYQIARLKTYICETEQTHKPALAWKMEKEAVDNKLQISQAENEKLNSTLELMDVRFQALSDILSVQEKELDQFKVEGAGRSKQASSLITRWREKVFCLLVQQKAAEILHKKEVSKVCQKMQRLENELTDYQSQVEILQHSLIDSSAQLQIEFNKTQKLEQELKQTHQVSICLDDQSRQDYNRVMSLSECFKIIKNQTDDLMRTLAEKSGMLTLMSQRVSFASIRMELIKTQFFRMSAMSLGLSKDAVQASPVTHVGQDLTRSKNGDHEKSVYQELDTVTRERDSLAAQVRADSEKWPDIFRKTKHQYEAEVESLTRKLESVYFQIQQKSKNCVQLTEEVEILKEDIKKKDNLINHLQAELSVHKQGVEAVLTDKQLRDEAEWSHKLADLDRKLNNAKREHAKAVVSLRQLENSHKRRLQQEQDLLKTTESHLTRQIQQLESRLRSVETERNLMMSTLRQEGLLDQLKSDRGRYFQHVDESLSGRISLGYTSDDKLTIENLHSGLLDAPEQICGEAHAENYHVETTSPRSPHEPVHLVLEGLKSLTVALFDDDDEDKENDKQNDSDGDHS